MTYPWNALRILHGIETGTRHGIHGNVQNTGLIENLPYGCCVEVPCMVAQTGIHPLHVGKLPPQIAGLIMTQVPVQELTVKAIEERRRDYIYYAAFLVLLQRKSWAYQCTVGGLTLQTNTGVKKVLVGETNSFNP